jgi:hypothetical protein
MAERAIRVEIPGLRWSPGAPEPIVLASERRTLFSFYRSDRDVTDDNEVQVGEFINCTAVSFGFPNDEALPGHRLWGRGLEYYALHEVLDSAWLEAIRSVERVHPRAAAIPFPETRHYVLTFHDTTLEALARQVQPMSTYATMPEAISAMVSIL